jgi:hypothetical protein
MFKCGVSLPPAIKPGAEEEAGISKNSLSISP